MKKELIQTIAASLHSYGYTVYISGNGEYGFYTDGKRVVSFGGSLRTAVDFGGIYRTDAPRYGTGWALEGGQHKGSVSEEEARKFITEHAPRWAIGGACLLGYTTPEQHLKTYQTSSHYTVYAPENNQE